MAKKPWYAPIFKGAELHVIKTRCRKDRYFYEIVRPNKKTIKWNPEISEKIGDCPDLEDTWHSGKIDGQMFDLNLMDSSVFGSAKTALGACFYEVIYNEGKTPTEWVYVKSKVLLARQEWKPQAVPLQRKHQGNFSNSSVWLTLNK
jgi:hypothetical protein